MKTVMIIAGGTWQVPLIKKVKSKGYKVVNTNLYKNSEGFKYADIYEVADVLDKEQNLKIAKKYNVDAILTDQSDIAVPTVAFVAQEMGCPSIGTEIAQLFTNKYKMRKFCAEKGFKTPEYKLCLDKKEAKEFLENLGDTAIMKPLDSQSSRGVFTIKNPEEIDQYFEATKSFSQDKESVLIERYISGPEFTVDGIVINGKHHTLAISEKTHFSYNENIASKLYFTYDNSTYDYSKLRREHDKLVNSTGLKFGLTHTEYKYSNGKFYLIEMAARGGGTKISSDIVPFMSGVDNYDYLIEYALGNIQQDNLPDEIPEKYRKRTAILEFLDIESNGKTVADIEGEDEITKIKEVADFHLEFSAGDKIKRANDDRSRIGYFIILAENKEIADQIEKKVKNILKIKYKE